MKALTIRHPWAWAVAEAARWPDVAKVVENRSSGFNTHHRGRVLIHSAKAWSPRGAADERVKSLWVQGDTGGQVGDLDPTSGAFSFGCGLAVAQLVDVHPDTGCCRPWGESEYVGSDQQMHQGVTHHLVWEDVRSLEEPVPCRGALGLWNVPAHVVAAVEVQLT